MLTAHRTLLRRVDWPLTAGVWPFRRIAGIVADRLVSC